MLFVEEPVLRVRAILALLIFTAITILWTPMVLPLGTPPFSLSHTEIGLFGLAGAMGAVGASSRRPARRSGICATGDRRFAGNHARLLAADRAVVLFSVGPNPRRRHDGLRASVRTRCQSEPDLPRAAGSTQPAHRRLHDLLLDRLCGGLDRFDARLCACRLDWRVHAGSWDQRRRHRFLGAYSAILISEN